MLENVDFDEAKQSQLPLVELLVNLGYAYVSREDALAQRGGDTGKFLLRDVARQALMDINEYESDEQLVKFSDADVAAVVEELETIRLNGLIDTSQEVTHMLMPKIGGKTIEVFANGRRENRSFRYIDFSDNGVHNQYHVTVEYKVTGKESIRCDVVCFVNGIPMVVIENKKSSVDITQAVNQLQRYQKPDQAPKLFVYPQLLVATNGANWLYGTTGTPGNFYAGWREKEVSEAVLHSTIADLIAKPIDQALYRQILRDLNGYTAGREQMLQREIKPQDVGAYAMLRPERLLDIAKNFVFYDGPYKKVARYQQYFAIHKMLRRIHQTDTLDDGSQKRRGGIVWHTQGSGKSLTMVLFVRALIEDPEIVNPRILIVTDRRDLDRQIKNTFLSGELKKEVVQTVSGEDLLNRIRNKDSAVLTTLVQKFKAASNKRSDYIDRDPNIFVLVDEAHRTQGGEANLEMLRTIANACYIAFTGTPLLKDEKSRNKFGDFIDQYNIDDALQDGIVLPLIYEGRYIPLYDDDQQIDRQWDREVGELPQKQKYQLQNETRTSLVAESRSRIVEICHNIQDHYIERFQGTGLKGQIVAPSKPAALAMQRFFEKYGKIQTALVISDENGEINPDDEKRKAIDEYQREIKDNYQSLLKYEEKVVQNFVDSPDGIELIIVVDKLLTGFDAPRNTVLYLAKQLKDHNLLQAIARVNRLFDNPNVVGAKTCGYIIDYSENAVNIHTAMELFGNFDPTDVQHTLIDVDQKVNELQQTYGQVCGMFNGVPADDQALLDFLADEPTRRTFDEKINELIRIFGECLSLQSFAEKFDTEKIDLYKRELKKFQNLKRSAALQYGDTVDLRKYRLEMVRILDENIKAGAAEVLTDEIEITDREQLDRAIEDLGSDKSKAEAIAAQTTRRISERRDQDQVLYDRFSQRIKEILAAMREKKLADIEALKQLRLLSQEVDAKQDSDLPTSMRDTPGADIFYRNLRDKLPVQNAELYEQTVLDLTKIVQSSATVDWWRSFESKRQMRSRLDDYLYDILHVQNEVNLDYKQIEAAIDRIMNLAENNHELFG